MIGAIIGSCNPNANFVLGSCIRPHPMSFIHNPKQSNSCSTRVDLSGISYYLVNSLGKVLDIVVVEASHADATVLGHVDVELLSKLENL